jgi:hypothetical protein
MDANYLNEVSGLKISRMVFDFLLKYLRNFLNILFYDFYLTVMSLALIGLPSGLLLLTFGIFLVAGTG